MSANRTAAAARTSTSALDPEMEFDRLYRRRSGAVYSMMLRLSRSTGVAEDLMQETFLRGWRAFPTFRCESAPATWLHVIALRVWSDWARAFRPDIADIEYADRPVRWIAIARERDSVVVAAHRTSHPSAALDMTMAWDEWQRWNPNTITPLFIVIDGSERVILRETGADRVPLLRTAVERSLAR
ncbi:MAG: sigma factor [Gemmatimonadaceae bacterium]